MNEKKWTPYLFLFLPVLVYVLWVIAPIFQTIIYSFTNWDGISPSISFTGFENFIRLFTDPHFITSLKNNVIWIIAFVFISVPAGLFVAMIFDQKIFGSKLYKTLFYLPMTLSFVVVGQVWSWIYAPDNGVFNVFLSNIKLDGLTQAWLSDPKIVTFSVIGAALWRQIPYSMVLFLAGLKNVSKDLIDAAYVDGANAFQRFFHIIIPALKPAIVVAVTVNIIDSLRAFDIVNVLTRGGPFYSSSVIANYMYIQSFNNYQMGYGSSIAVIQFLITITFIIIYLKYVLKKESE
ncbi:MAG: sugar ABC transporter permease [Thermotogota bacterium]|nr:sugar ABC transporter permease [Thermotogota bacterium]